MLQKSEAVECLLNLAEKANQQNNQDVHNTIMYILHRHFSYKTSIHKQLEMEELEAAEYISKLYGELEKYGSKEEKEQFCYLPEISEMLIGFNAKKEFAKKIVRNFMNGKYNGILDKLKGA